MSVNEIDSDESLPSTKKPNPEMFCADRGEEISAAAWLKSFISLWRDSEREHEIVILCVWNHLFRAPENFT